MACAETGQGTRRSNRCTLVRSLSAPLLALALAVTASACTPLLDPATPAPSGSALDAGPLYVDPDSPARRQAATWASARPADAATLDRLGDQPQAAWFGDWNPDVAWDVGQHVSRAAAVGAVPVLVAYDLPLRDCGSYSGGGAGSPGDYRSWVDALARGIGERAAVVVLEPDALALTSCLSAAQQEERIGLLRHAVQTLKARPGVDVYIDAGHAGWVPVLDMAARLTRAGIAQADGFALNVSNFGDTAGETRYGQELARAMGRTHFVIDTSRNGLGSNGEWCNPAGRAVGTAPTTDTGDELVDAFLWVKRPGESDGTCNGGPSAGSWWPDYALGLAQRATSL